MMVSIIVPVYNSEKYLQECLDSAINQTYPDTEIIAVYDNGCMDRSLEILKKCSDKIKIVSVEHGGTSASLNAGIKTSKGEWIKTLDSDDVLYPNAIEDLISETKNLNDKKHTILYAYCDFINSKGQIIGHDIQPNYNELDGFHFNVILLDHHIGNTSTVFFHKSTIEEYGMFDETISYEDYELRLRYCLLHNCRMHLIQKILTKYRIHQNQTTKIKIRKASKETDKIRKHVLAKLSSTEREKYENALKYYKKSKPSIVKVMYFVRYTIISILPRPLAVKVLNVYWFMRSKKNLNRLFFTKLFR